MYKATIICDSICEGNRLTTMEVTLPRIVLAEFNTHRKYSRNSASSRAIPVKTNIKRVLANPFIPEAFASNQKGMSAGANLSRFKNWAARTIWKIALYFAVAFAWLLSSIGAHKQWANRLIECFSYTTIVVTSVEWENFFALRISPHAQPEIRRAAELMKYALDESVPKTLKNGEWHLPYFDSSGGALGEKYDIQDDERRKKISSARCARVSYLTQSGKRDWREDLLLHDRLVDNGHMSPTEHVAQAVCGANAALDDFGNFSYPWLQYRKMIPNESNFGERTK